MITLPPVCMRSAVLTGNHRRVAIAALLIAAVAGIVWAWHGISLRPALLAIAGWARHRGSTAYVLFGIGYLVAVFIALPTSLLTALAGFLYGPLLGSAIVLPPSLLGSALSFWVVRSGA